MAALLKDGRAHVTGLYSEKSGKTYDATVVLEDTGQYVNFKLEFDRQKIPASTSTSSWSLTGRKAAANETEFV